jgi:hypothetical protein
MQLMVRLIYSSDVKLVIFGMKTPDFLSFLKLLSDLSTADFFLLQSELFRRCFRDLNVFRCKFFS